MAEEIDIEQVVVGSQTYRINLSDQLVRGDAVGQIDHWTSTIELASFLDIQAIRSVLAHEITHAILQQSGIEDMFKSNDMRDLTEYLVTAIGNGWVRVIRDNPDIVKLMQEAE